MEENEYKNIMLNILKTQNNFLLRENKINHFTASSWIVNPEKTKVLMIHHNLYKSWAWTGGHADGEENLLEVALKEAKEETGLKHLNILSNEIFSIEILNVEGHIKNNQFIAPHLHLNFTFLFEASENDKLSIKEDENSGVQWISIDKIALYCSEEKMIKIYNKLNSKLNNFLKNGGIK